MKRLLVILVLASMPAFTQQAPKSAPQLSTADHIALQSCEKTKQDAQKMWQEALQQEREIIAEFNASHSGYHINPQNFAVEADQPKTVQPALPEKK